MVVRVGEEQVARARDDADEPDHEQHPRGVALDRRVPSKRVEGRQALGEGHLVVQSMQPLVAQAADRDTLLQDIALVVLAEVFPAMDLARDQVMEGQ